MKMPSKKKGKKGSNVSKQLSKLSFTSKNTKEGTEYLQLLEDSESNSHEGKMIFTDDDTVPVTNASRAAQVKGKAMLQITISGQKADLKRLRSELAQEKYAKRKLYSSLIKLANELKRTKEASVDSNITPVDKPWYQGGMWRSPELLPSVQKTGDKASALKLGKDPVSLSDLFLDLVIVTALTRVGGVIQDRGTLDGPILAYFALFWLIWGKEASYGTRFDTTDLSSQVETLFTCFAVLFGSLSSHATFDSHGATRIMKITAFVSILHFFLHLRVYYWFRGSPAASGLLAVRDYAFLIMTMTALESITWIIGILFVPVSSPYRYLVFVFGILFSLRIPRSFLQNDFHAACSKRGVLFILLLGFVLQSIVLVATPFFEYQSPSNLQYVFLALVLFLLFCIKLLYVDDSFSITPTDHALLVGRSAGFLYHTGQFGLLLSTTTLGAGLNLLTHSYLASTESLPDKAKNLVCAGFSALIFCIAFIKSLHVRRVPINRSHKMLFYAAYATQLLVILAVVYMSAQMCMVKNGLIGFLVLNEIEMLSVLLGMALFVLIVSWLDEGIELSLYGSASEGSAHDYRIHPFGIWFCFKSPVNPDPSLPKVDEPNQSDKQRMAHLSPFVTESEGNIFGSDNLYGSFGNEDFNNDLKNPPVFEEHAVT